MGKIVGKIFISCLSLIAVCLDARVVMEVRTENGSQNNVVVGQPFTLEVMIDDVYGSIQAPKIKGLDKFVARQSGSYMSSINGKSTARYSYQLRIDTIGSYVLGPAVITHQQQEFVSNEVRVNVVKDVGVAMPNNKSNQTSDAKAFLRLMVDAESVVVGQKIGCMLRFYYQDPSLSLHNIGIPELSGFDIKDIGKLESGTAEVDGVPYRYAQWRWEMYPKKPGEFIIPAYNADYDLPVKENNHLLGSLFMFINNRIDRKRVYSNAVSIKVSPLPHCDHDVHAVGLFERITAEIKPGMAKAGEGMVLVIEIEGDGNLQAIVVPTLKMPESLKYYDSNSTIIAPRHADELPKKRFEFIVQGMQCGDCKIPEQLFTYFDIERHAYVTLRTTPLAVSIMPGVHNPKKDTVAPITSIEQPTVVVAEDKIVDINKVGQWYPVSEQKSLPWWLFQILFLMPCMYLGYPFVIEKFVVLSSNSTRFKRRRAFKQARKKIDQAAKNGEDKNLYAIFMQLLQELGYSSDVAVLSKDNTEGLNNFFELMKHAAYAQSDNKNTDELCRMAKQWLDHLEKNI